MKLSRRNWLALLMILLTALAVRARAAETLNGHRVVLDSEGKLISWVEPQDRAYDRVMRLAWDFLLHQTPAEANGLKSYFTYCSLDPVKVRGLDWPHNPAGLYGMLADSARAYYAYSGDRQVVELVQSLLDYQLAHGMTPAGWNWAGVPYASADAGALEYRGADQDHYCALAGRKERPCGVGDGRFTIEPDKVGEFGYGALEFYELTGEARYRQAAIVCANALAAHVRQGSARQSPWPFRVYAETGKPVEDYTANVIGPIRLLDEMIRLRLGDAASYRRARRAAWDWLMVYPMKDNVWEAYFEDVPINKDRTNFNQYSALETARYLIEHSEFDPDWREHVAGLIAWAEKTFVVDVPKEPAVQWGAGTVSEQITYMHKMGSHTSRYASVLALWYEKTGDAAARAKAFRSFNWATYMCRENGLVNVGPIDQTVWFSDGYGDYIRHFMAGLGSVPAWAPKGETHLLRSSSVVREISYQPQEVNYRTFDSESREVLKLNFAPGRVWVGGAGLPRRDNLTSPGWTFDGKEQVLRIYHRRGHSIRIVAAPKS
jgi:hypothetical protein